MGEQKEGEGGKVGGKEEGEGKWGREGGKGGGREGDCLSLFSLFFC